MEWSLLYGSDNQPASGQIDEYVNNELWQNLNTYLQDTYQILPKLSYSRCSMQPGWNVKYQKSGKALCTLYPMQNTFIALVVIGNKEASEADMLLPSCSEYTRALYESTAFSLGGRWLMLQVTNFSILGDVIKLIQLRVKPKEKNK
ncbi:DUF3788 domain-containing protein [Anaerocolumna sp. MB42-C2]|uniref:DUF3788 domain-containing protein n=1 Tax=Anaerocolumna sp. MB42-C2 TaxID=3070997 RepID=UPI0027E1498D|nr:DUF3788 domain-containing protein [Anaerocolumna sp. MB42-C2]WMJ89016.1 DUF3788 domain-containing protein [Anaerocolumna sp. MB42-C2]